MIYMSLCCHFFFFKQKTAYEMRISDWSSDVCSSDLVHPDVVSPVGERDCGHSESTDGFVSDGVVVIVPVAPYLPGGVQAEQQWDETEIRDRAFRKEKASSEGDGDGGNEDATETEVLPNDDLGGGASLPGAAREAQEQDNTVVDVRDQEQSDCLQCGGGEGR